MNNITSQSCQSPYSNGAGNTQNSLRTFKEMACSFAKPPLWRIYYNTH